MSFKELKDMVELPKSQRNLVWSTRQKEDFIDTLHRGYPFGSFLLSLNAEGNWRYRLIDGLQRFKTVQEYEEKRYAYIDFDYVFKEELKDLFDAIGNIKGTCITAKSKIEAIKTIKSCFVANINKETPWVDIRNMLKESQDLFDDNKLRDTLDCTIEKMVNKSLKYIDLDKLYFPAIIYKGEVSNLPEIYERINSTGTQLSKYEILAATWNDAQLRIEDKALLNIIDNRYMTIMNESELTVSEYEEGSIIKAKELNLFEYVYAIGVMIIEAAPCLFPDKGTKDTKKQTPDSIGCLVTAGCLKIPMTNIKSLYPVLKKLDIVKLKVKIIEAAKAINNTLQKFILMGAGKNSNISKFTEQQIAAIICTAFEIKNLLTSSAIIDRTGSRRNWDSFIKNLPYHYLYETLNDTWTRRNGNKNFNEIIEASISSKKYISHISVESWTKFLDNWVHEQIKKESEKIGIEHRLFLNYLRVLSNGTSNFKNLVVAPIISVKELKSTFGKTCCAALGNLTIITPYEKRMSYQNGKPLIFSSHDPKELYHPENSELQFAKNANTFTEDNYKKFITNRHNYLISKFTELIDK